MILPSIVFVLLGVIVLCAVLVYKMSLHAVESAERAHSRSNDYNKDLLDRLMAMDFNTYKAYNLETGLDTGYTPPAAVEELPVESRRRGFGSNLGLAADFDQGDDSE